MSGLGHRVMGRVALRVAAVVTLCLLPVGAIAHQGTATSGPIREGPAVIDPAEVRVGERVDDLAFTDLAGAPGQLSDYRDRKAVVVCMTGAGCPVARRYGPVLGQLARSYAEQGVAFLVVNPNATEVGPKSRAAAAAMGPHVRYVADADGTVGRSLGARSTTEVFVLDAARTLAYRGAVDDQFGLGYSLAAPRHRYLVDALDAVLSGRRPAVAATTAPGCALDFARAPSPAEKPVTYHNQIARLIQNKCADCHRPGESAPFPVLSYDDVIDHKAMIKRVVSRGTMPPWFADPKTGHWANDLSLSVRERATLLAWIDAGAPEGDPKDAPLPRTYADGWRIGKPDLVLEAPRSFNIPATGAMEYQHVVVLPKQAEDRWVRAIEIRPSRPEVVHHVLVFVKYPLGHPRAGEQPKYRGGLGGYFAGLVPNQGHITFPVGTAKYLPAGAALIFQIHYTPNGTPAEDRPKIGFVFHDGPPKHEIMTLAAFNHRFRIPPNDPNHEITANYTFKGPARLLSFNPHAHLRGKAFRYDLTYPDGQSRTVLNVPRYDFNWQLEYQLRDPIDVPAGTVLKVTGWYDNSKANPANPDPDREVRHGEQTWEEMMIGYFTGHRLDGGTGSAIGVAEGEDEVDDD